MSNWPFRFIHAADFHLETPPFGVEEVPEHLTELLLEAAYWSASTVFETALAEKVDFVVLSGDLLHSRHTGPRGPLFLVEQFERLAERNIAVYWAGGRIDPPEAWPASMLLPENVYVFGRGKPEQCIHRRDDTALARLIGASRPAEGKIRPKGFDAEHPGLFSIAVAHGRWRLELLKAARVDYWALGGGHARRTLCESMPVVHDPGSPQGRHPEETGPHGCTLVEVDLERNTRLTFMPTDAIRWECPRIVLDETSTPEGLEHEMVRRVESLRQSSPKTDFLISWNLGGAGSVVNEARRGTLGAKLLGRLRERFGHGPPAAWSVAIAVDPSARAAASWYEEDTIRGEFLRELREREKAVDEPLDLEDVLPEKGTDDALRKLLLHPPEASRLALLGEAATLGVDLLDGEEAES
ncbi:MAG: DNA repair exonuclease [Pirellulales bacterium]|nr:DNA repair exonuclease [Pirellulales bacterium]